MLPDPIATSCPDCNDPLPPGVENCPNCGRTIVVSAQVIATERGVAAGRDINAPVITGDILAPVTIEYSQLPEIPAPPEPDRPPAVIEFVGRQAELAYYTEKLASAHIAVIAGMAGVGKTSLAAVLARQAAGPEKIFWHSFHENEDIEAVLWELAGFLAWQGQDGLWKMFHRTQQTGGRQMAPELVFNYLLQGVRGRGYLLCLDDLHLIEDDPLLGRFLDDLRQSVSAGEMHLIITTRRMPDFVHSVQFEPLPGFSLPDTQALLAARRLDLPLELVKSLQEQTGGNAQLLTLAAHLLQRSDAPDRLVDRLLEADDVERYLLREVDEGLSVEERELMSAVAVLLGYPARLETIQAVMNGANPRRVLRRLSDQFLLNASPNEIDRQYWQHAIVREFYYDQLGQGEKQAMHWRAGAFFESEALDPFKAALQFERAGDFLKSAQIAVHNLWAILNQGLARSFGGLLDRLKTRQLDELLRAEVAIARGQVHALLGEGEPARESYRQALESLASLPVSPARLQLEIRVYSGMGEVLEFEAPQEALEWLQRGLEVGEAASDLERAALHITAGTIHMHLGNYPQAVQALETGLGFLPEGPSQLRSTALIGLGNVYYFQGDAEKGKSNTERALAISKELNDYLRTANILTSLGFMLYTAGDWQGGIAALQEALTLAEQLGSQKLIASLELNLGGTFIYSGDDSQAAWHLNRGLEISQQSSQHFIEIMARLRLTELHILRREWEAARAQLREAERFEETLAAPTLQIEIHWAWAEIHLGEGEIQAALEAAQRSVALGREVGEEFSLARNLRVLGRALLANQQPAPAIEAFQESLKILEGQDAYEAARTKVEWGLALLTSPADRQAGIEFLTAARQVFDALGAKRDLENLNALG